MNKFKITNSK